MKQKLIYLIILLLGILIGVAIDHYFLPPISNTIQKNNKTKIVEKIKQRIIRDTVEIKKIIKIPVAKSAKNTSEEKLIDSLIMLQDSINTANSHPNTDQPPSPKDTITTVLSEELIGEQLVILPPFPTDSTSIENILAVKPQAFADKILVEFWSSPLNLVGYQLTRNKLKLYGFNPNENINLAYGKSEDELILTTPSVKVYLRKTKQFKSLSIQ